MADFYNSDSEPTTRTLLRRVLDTADSRTPRRLRSAGAGPARPSCLCPLPGAPDNQASGPHSPTLHQRSSTAEENWSLHSAQRALLETPSSRRLNSGTKTTAKQHSHGARSIGRLAHFQVSGNLEEQTPRTLLKNILLTAPESSILMPETVVKPVPALQVVQPSRKESSRGSLELQLPEFEPPTTLAAGLPAPSRKKQRLRLSVFQQEVDQGLPHSQEHPGNADASSLTSSLNLSFATPLQPQSVKRPGLARRPPLRRAVDVGALLQDLRDDSLASAPSGDSLKTPIATLPTDTVLEDTQPFSQPLVGCSPSVHHFLPHPFPTGTEDAERAMGHGTQSSGPGLQNHMSGACVAAPSLSFLEPQPWSAAAPEIIEAEDSQGTVEAEEPEGSSEDENTSDRPAELAASTPEFLQAKQLHPIPETAPPPGVAVLSSETLEPASARLPRKPRTAGSRPRQDSYKAGLNHYIKLFSFYAKMPMERKAFEMVEKCLDKYFQQLCNDLEVFAAHAGRKTVRPEDLELLMRRQGLITDQVSLYVLVERHLPLEYRQLLIPCAFSGNSVFPAL